MGVWRRLLATLLLVLGAMVVPSSRWPTLTEALAAPAPIPAGGLWTLLPTAGAPSPRYLHSAVWTGSEMLVWGGGAGGAAYSPATDAWRPLPTNGAPSPRYNAAVVWTGTELLIWGGYGITREANGDLGDGAAYSPATDAWRPLPTNGTPSPRSPKVAVWTGTELVVWGSDRGASDGAAYNPAANAWRPLPTVGAPPGGYPASGVWGGTDLLVWVGGGVGARYTPATNTWAPLATAEAPGPRAGASAVWDGAAMLIWGGARAGAGTSQIPLNTGAAYDPATNTWSPLPTVGAPSPRYRHTAVWDGAEMLIWGGIGPTTGALGDGAAYNPATKTWRPLPTTGAPSPRCWHTAVWSGAQMLIWGGNAICDGFGSRLLGDGAAYTPAASTVPHDARYFAQTGYRIDDDTIWDYFNRRGGIPTFGYPTSRTFLFQGFTVQFFQRRIVQLDQQGHARLLNLLDPSLLNYTQFNGSTFPGVESALVATAPPPTDQPAVLAWVQQHAPDGVAGAPVNFDATFLGTVSAQTAFPNGGDASLLPGIDLEMWGIPTSQTMMDVNNHHFIYLRWQRGIMMYDASCTCTQGVLLADYLKAILTGRNLPADLAQEAANSPFLDQYDPSAPNWVHNPSLLPNTDLTNAFTPE